jgi:menaquinone-dependent protoporphyrinogen IX oxidase
MKLNYRDRIVLTAVIVILVWVAGVMLFIKPSIERLQNSQTALDDAKATLSDLKERNKADENLPERINKAYEEVTEMTKTFYSMQENQAASQKVDELLDENDIKNLDLTISQYTPFTLKPYAYVSSKASTEIDEEVQKYINETGLTPDTADAEAGEKGEAEAVPVVIGSYEITLSYKGKIDDVEKFCDKMQKSAKEKTMVVKSIDYKFVAETDDEGKPKTEEIQKGKKKVKKTKISDTDVEGTMTLTMMVIEKLPKPNV